MPLLSPGRASRTAPALLFPKQLPSPGRAKHHSGPVLRADNILAGLRAVVCLLVLKLAHPGQACTLFLLTVPPCRNLPCKAPTSRITCIRLCLPQGFHKLQHSPASIFHPWRKEVKRVNQRDSQTVSPAWHWRQILGRALAPQQQKLAEFQDLAKHRRSHVHSAGGAASSPACEHLRDQELPRRDQS